MQCEYPDCEESESFNATTQTPHQAGWRLVDSRLLDIDGTSANTRLCPDCAEDLGYL